jgi:hypothetical protein
VVGYIALFCFVLGGTAIALPGKNKVDSGDIKKNGVRAADIAPKAVTAAKIAPRSVDGLRVIDNSLTGEDIEESTLNIRPAPSSIGPTELADRQRRLVFTPGTLVPGGTGEEPKLEGVGPFPALSFPDADGFASLSTDVPGSRVEGTKLTVRLLWSATGNGTVVWDISYAVVGTGGAIESVPTTKSEVQSGTTAGTLTTAASEIPAGAVSNGQLIGVTIERNGTDPADTLSTDARLQLVEIDYTATG